MEELGIRSPINNAPIFYKPSVVSTMDEAAALADAGAPAGTVILTDYQSQGRGRRTSRGWSAERGESLLFTVIVKRPDDQAGLLKAPLVAGLAVAAAAESLYALRLSIKWPNDVLADGRKLAGILCLARGQYILAGIGINCLQQGFPPAFAAGAVSLAMLVGAPVEREPLLLAVLSALGRWLDDPVWRPAIEARLAFRGERRRLLSEAGGDSRAVEGIVRGLGERGELLLETAPGRVERFFSGSLVSPISNM